MKDKSLYLLILTNLASIVIAIVDHWQIAQVMWVYWIQSMIIGYFHLQRIKGIKSFSTAGLTINNKAAKPTEETKKIVSLMFGLFYGIFCLSLLLGLVARFRIGLMTSMPLLLNAGLYYINHRNSFLYNSPKEPKKQNIGVMMILPFLRIIPVYVALIGAIIPDLSVIIFMIAKSIIDGMMHTIEHSILRQGKALSGEITIRGPF